MSTTANPSQLVLPLRSRVTCPHCWNEFPPDRALWIAQHPDLVGDPRLGADQPQRFLPTRFNVQGAAIDSRGFACHGLACPKCHLAVPRPDVRDAADVPLDPRFSGQRQVVFPGGHDLAAAECPAQVLCRGLQRRRSRPEPSAARVRVAPVPESQPGSPGCDRKDRSPGRPLRHGALRRSGRQLSAPLRLLALALGRAPQSSALPPRWPDRSASTTTRARVSCRARTPPRAPLPGTWPSRGS